MKTNKTSTWDSESVNETNQIKSLLFLDVIKAELKNDNELPSPFSLVKAAPSLMALMSKVLSLCSQSRLWNILEGLSQGA